MEYDKDLEDEFDRVLNDLLDNRVIRTEKLGSLDGPILVNNREHYAIDGKMMDKEDWDKDPRITRNKLLKLCESLDD